MSIKVLFLPFEGDKNPYQRKLAQVVRDQGVSVLFLLKASAPLRSALRLKRNQGLDIIHLHWTSPFLVSSRRSLSMIKGGVFLLAIRLFKCINIRLVWTIHNLVSHEQQDSWLEVYFNRWLCQWVDRIIVHCPLAVDMVIESFSLPPGLREKFSVIPHGHFIADYPNQIGFDTARERLGLGPTEHTFLYFGQIRPYKNVFSLIEAFKRIDNQQVKLIIAGLPWDTVIEKQISVITKDDPRIRTHLSWIPDEDMQLYLNAADVVVLPFVDILSSSTVILAMSFGKPVITPSLGCSCDLLAGQSELLYTYNQPDGLFLTMNKSLKMDLPRIGAQNYMKIQADTWETVGQATARVYQELMGVV